MSSSDTDFEPSDASPKLLGAIAGGLVAVIALVVVGLLIGFPMARHDRRKAPDSTLPPAPRLQIDTSVDQAASEKAALDRLTSAGWVDRAGGRVHIPVGEAMRLIGERGLPAWPKPAP